MYLEIHTFKTLTDIKIIVTDNFRVCCITPNKESTCTAAPEWPTSCEDLISNVYLYISLWIMTLSVIVLNLSSLVKLSLFKTKIPKRSCFHIIAIFLNISDLTCGIYMSFLVGASAYLKGSFAVDELHWRQCLQNCSKLLHILSIFFYFSDNFYGNSQTTSYNVPITF